MAKRVLVSLSLLVLLALLLPSAFADSHARIVRLSDLSGNVQIDRAAGNGFEKAILNMPVTKGAQLQTSADGRAEVQFEDGSTVRLGPDSRVEFTALGLRTSGARASTVQIDRGVVYVNFFHRKDDEMQVVFGNRQLNLDRAVRFRVDMSSSDARLSVYKGELKVQGTTETATVKKGETLTLELSDYAQLAKAKGITELPSDDWNQQRAAWDDQYANIKSNNLGSVYGYSDLSYYGDYTFFPGYGYLWRPYGMAMGWDPFATGAWAFYPGFGYTFVSGYPWGWLPYHYGNWNYVPGWGWGWVPGPTTAFVAVPTVVNPPRVWTPPRPPRPAPAGIPPTVAVGNHGIIPVVPQNSFTGSATGPVTGPAVRPMPGRVWIPNVNSGRPAMWSGPHGTMPVVHGAGPAPMPHSGGGHASAPAMSTGHAASMGGGHSGSHR